VSFLSEIAACCRYEAVTLPENVMDMEVEQPMLFTYSDAAKFRAMVILVIFGFWKGKLLKCIISGAKSCYKLSPHGWAFLSTDFSVNCHHSSD
jgi:hypothetical protein